MQPAAGSLFKINVLPLSNGVKQKLACSLEKQGQNIVYLNGYFTGRLIQKLEILA